MLFAAFAWVDFFFALGHRAVVKAIALIALLFFVALFASGCITPLTMEQQSDWRWQQYNPDYRPLEPRDPGLGNH